MLDNQTKNLVDLVIFKQKKKLDREMIALAQNNRVLYYSGLLSHNEEIILSGDDWITKLRRTIKFVQKVLGSSVEYSITRTYKYTHYITFDIDLFSPKKDFKKATEEFRKNGCQILSHDNSLGGRLPGRQVNVKKDGLLTIDFHNNFTWQKRTFLDPELLEKDHRFENIEGVKTKIPSAEVEFLLCVSDVAHERFNFTLLDLIWIEGSCKEIKDWDLIFDQIKKHGWWWTFSLVAKRINGLSQDIYQKELIPKVGKVSQVYSLPYFIPAWICWISYLENFLKTHHISFVSFAYMNYCKLKYYMSGKKRMPYYENWYIQK